MLKANDALDLCASGSEDDSVPPCGPIRIHNLDEFLRQLEKQNHDSLARLSPSESEEIRMSEPEADRHVYSSTRTVHQPSIPSSSSASQQYKYRHHSSSSAISAIDSHHLVEQDLAYLLGHHVPRGDGTSHRTQVGVPGQMDIPLPPPPPSVSSTSRFSH